LKKDSITAIFVSLPYEGYPEISSGSFDASGDEALATQVVTAARMTARKTADGRSSFAPPACLRRHVDDATAVAISYHQPRDCLQDEKDAFHIERG
jgi:hypothetical protein